MTDLKNVEILDILKERFEENSQRHENISWKEVEEKLKKDSSKIDVLIKMEETGGEPDVVDFKNGLLTFVDCSKESPKERRSLCYDNEALEARKKNKPRNSAIGLANEIGVKILTEEEYRYLQGIEEFDVKTSTWVETPEEVRKNGGSIFCDKRYGRVFTYHNGADSYYASRGFRSKVEI